MLRLLSVLLLLAGAAVAVLGGWLYMGNELPAGLLGASETVVERKVLEPEEYPEPAAMEAVEEEVIAIAPAPPPPAAAESMEVAEPVIIEPEPVNSAPAPEAKSAASTTARTRSLEAPAEMADAAPMAAPVPESMMETASAPEAAEAMAAEDDMIFGTETMDMEDILAIEPAAGPPPPPTIEEQLYSVPIAYETPSKATFGQSFNVTLSINARDGATTATGGLTGGGSIVEAEAMVSDRVEAALNGDAFKIELKSPKRLKLSKATESLWRWKVTPIKSGAQDLTFDLFSIDANNEAEMVRTFNDTVTVEVSRVGQAVFLAQQYNPIMMILAGLGSLLAGLFGAARFFRGS